MSNCKEIKDEEDEFPLDVKVRFHFYDKDEFEGLIKDLETIKIPMAGIYDLIVILKSKLE